MDKSDLKCSLTHSLPKINKIITVFYHIEIRYLTVINFYRNTFTKPHYYINK